MKWSGEPYQLIKESYSSRKLTESHHPESPIHAPFATYGQAHPYDPKATNGQPQRFLGLELSQTSSQWQNGKR
jgi:hypothetical protein